MGKPSEPETVRNQEMYNDWKLDHSRGVYTRLGIKYGITKQRVRKIINRERLNEVLPDILNDQN